MSKYICMRDPVEAITAALLDHIKTDPQEERFIHGIDFSRSKYVIKEGGKWKIDFHAKKLIPQFIKTMHDTCNDFLKDNTTEMSNSQALAAIDLIETMEVKKTSELVSKKIYGELRLDKEHFLLQYKNLQALRNRIEANQ